jgi:ribosome-associated heat shock protein Hsp15
MAETALRIDKLLFFLRIAKSRTLAQGWAESGHIRVNGRRIEKASAMITAGDVITLPKGEAVLSIRLLSVPMRRGPNVEAQICYQLLE